MSSLIKPFQLKAATSLTPALSFARTLASGQSNNISVYRCGEISYELDTKTYSIHPPKSFILSISPNPNVVVHVESISDQFNTELN